MVFIREYGSNLARPHRAREAAIQQLSRERGVSPIWRKAKLVFVRKESKDAGSLSAYRPICLLDEADKLFERVIANRLVQHLSRMDPDLNEAQFGFREGRSMMDAIQRVRTLFEEVTSRGELRW